jgi:[acyl-carrier-protein] S-malonyltransferase
VNETSVKEPYALLFPGQGAHCAQMLDQYKKMADFSEYYQPVCEVLGFSPIEKIQADATKINTNLLSSILTLLSSKLALERFRESKLPSCNFYAGYSVGQYMALHAAGCFDFYELVQVISVRCRLMDSCFQNVQGAMLAIAGVMPAKVEEFVGELKTDGYQIWISNFNCAGQYSLAGEKSAIKEAMLRAQCLNPKKLIELPVGGAWHCPLLKGSMKAYADFLADRPWKSPTAYVINNVDGEMLPNSSEAIKHELVEHLSRPVQWERGIRTMIGRGVNKFTEIGYGNVLTKFGFFIDRNLKFDAFSGQYQEV